MASKLSLRILLTGNLVFCLVILLFFHSIASESRVQPSSIYNTAWNTSMAHEQEVGNRSPRLVIFSHTRSKGPCADSTMERWSFIREYYEDPQRQSDIITAVRQTICQNKCARFIFLMQNEKGLGTLTRLILDMDASADVFMVPPPLTMSHLFGSATWVNATEYFVVSTADVAISSLTHLEMACGTGLDALNLFVVSRRDNQTNDPSLLLLECTEYRDTHGSFDVYIGKRSLVQEQALQSLIFSPSYWGVENLTAFILARDKVFNLCPYIDVLHYHSSRKSQPWRPRINEEENSIHPPGVLGICDVDLLEEGRVQSGQSNPCQHAIRR